MVSVHRKFKFVTRATAKARLRRKWWLKYYTCMTRIYIHYIQVFQYNMNSIFSWPILTLTGAIERWYPGSVSPLGCARFAEIWQKYFEFQILWSLSSVDFHTLTLQLPNQTQNSVAPKLQVFEISAKWAHPGPCHWNVQTMKSEIGFVKT